MKGLWKHSSLSFFPAFLALMYIVDELFESNVDRHFKIKHTFNQAKEGKTHTSMINENLKNEKESAGIEKWTSNIREKSVAEFVAVSAVFTSLSLHYSAPHIIIGE